MARDKRRLSWGEIELYVEALIKELRTNTFEYRSVYAPPRGGLVLAVMLSNRLNIPMMMTPAEGSIIVDDICDYGEVLRKYHMINENQRREGGVIPYYITTFCAAEEHHPEFGEENRMPYNVTPIALDFVGEWLVDTKNKPWIIFPWEEADVKTESSKN